MGISASFHSPADCPSILPLFPLPGALLLPRGQLPLNIFEPRYLEMIDDALKSHRMIGIIQPDNEMSEPVLKPGLYSVGCVGRISQFAEAGDGRLLITLTGISRFAIEQELDVLTPYRQAKVTYESYPHDFIPRHGEEEVDREGVIDMLRLFVEANDIRIDWREVQDTPNEALVNALCMMSPFAGREKQALLEATDLKTRAEILIAISQMELARDGGPEPTLQ